MYVTRQPSRRRQLATAVLLVVLIIGLVLVMGGINLLPAMVSSVKASPISTEVETTMPQQEVLAELPTLVLPTETPLPTLTEVPTLIPPTETLVVVAAVPTETPIVIAQLPTETPTLDPTAQYPSIEDYIQIIPSDATRYGDDPNAPVSFQWTTVFSAGKPVTIRVKPIAGLLCYFSVGKADFYSGTVFLLHTAGGTINNIVPFDTTKEITIRNYTPDNAGLTCVFQRNGKPWELDVNQPDIAEAITNSMASDSGNCGGDGCPEVRTHFQQADGSFPKNYVRTIRTRVVSQPTNYKNGYFYCYDETRFEPGTEMSDKEAGALLIYVYQNSSVMINGMELPTGWYIIYGRPRDGSTPKDLNLNWSASNLVGNMCVYRFTSLDQAKNMHAVEAAMAQFQGAAGGFPKDVFKTGIEPPITP